jgi:hypothetical protein
VELAGDIHAARSDSADRASPVRCSALPPGAFVPDMQTERLANRAALVLVVPEGMSSLLGGPAPTTRGCGGVLGLSFGALIRSRPDGDSRFRPRCA